jgi:predicted outer membrane repeat protein
MKVLKILIVMLIFIMSVGAVCATENITDDAIGDDSQEILETVQEDITTDDSTDILETAQNDIYTANDDSFTNLTDEIKDKDVVDLTHDYKFNNETDDSNGIVISKDNFVLNGNGRTIDANNQSRIFNITANNITLSNLILKNGNAKDGGAIYSTGTLTLNNVTFTNNYATEKGGAVALYENVTLNCDDIRFIDNYGGAGSSIYVDKGNLNLYNSYITSNIFSKRGQIVFKKSKINVENTIFTNIAASYTPALYVEEGKEAYIINSKFINLMANISAGALAVKGVGCVYIKDCEFINTTSSKNAGAVLADIAGDKGSNGNITVLNTIFKDTYSEFGGAYLQLGGNLLLNNTEFTNSHATYNGGAIYLSYTESEVNNCTFTSNGVDVIEGYPTYGGAIFSDISTLKVDKSKFINNTASAANAIYAYDSSYTIKNSLFENNTNPIYTFFDKEGIIDETNIFINDNNISTNNEFHASIIVGQGMQLTLINNTVNVTTVPASFDLRNYSWVTPVRDQGWMGACWTFGMTSALESALLKATGISGDFSENNMQNTMLRYSIYGTPFYYEGGTNTVSAAYLLSWLGAFPQEADAYDELGKISPVITSLNDLHVQDVMFIPNNEIPNGTQIKLAIMKYGALDVSYFGQSTYNEKNPYYNPDTYAQYVNVTTAANHEVSVVGWDDNFPKERFLITPPDDGAWIIKNSWDTNWGDKGYLYVSYYDKSFTTSGKIPDYATAIIIENTEPYNKNYQYDLLWGSSFLPAVGNNVSYCNQFEALDDDLIAAVGTYFNSEGINYKVEIYVNDKLKLTQEGVSPYLGYHTIKLNEYIPIRQGDVFKVVMTSNAMPYINVAESRTHYTNNISFSCSEGTWEDNYDFNVIACLKVYTVANPTFSELQEAIANSTENYLVLNVDYEFNNETDNKIGIFIDRDNFVLNGNGHIIDGKNQSRIFAITANNVTLSNLILINGNTDNGGAVCTEGTVTLNNVTFINNYATQGGAVALLFDEVLNINNSKFIDNYGRVGSSIYVENGKLNLYNTEFTSDIPTQRSQIVIKEAEGYVDNATFANIVSNYTPAIHMEKSKALTILNSRFINLTANISSGAIGLKSGGELYIKNCEFINVSSAKNAGAILADIPGMDNLRPGNVTILDTVFRNTSSGFGGAYIQFGGKLLINNTEFTNGHATYNGGSVYISYVDYAEINNCNFTSNGVDIIEGYPTYGGAMVIDMSTISINNSRFINNTASAGNAIYAYDASYDIRNSLFENNTNPIYTFFDKASSLQNNVYINDDNVSTNNTFYATIMVGEGMQLTLINNVINVTALPARYDLRDWGWVSPVRNQGSMGACWTFGMTGVLESALLKSTGLAADLSENNMQDTMIKYSIYGVTQISEGGGNIISTGYLLSWLGAFTQDADTYDELGKLSPLITTQNDIHVQDVMFIPNNEIPNGTQLKWAILKYGSIDVNYNGQSTYDEVTPYYRPDTCSQYVNVPIPPNHDVSVVGWDDNYPKENFGIEPPGDGAWIVKNSWGTDFGDNGYLYVSYYDQSFLQYSPGTIFQYATAIIIENTIPYNKNYQYDLLWGSEFKTGNSTASYMNVFEALDDDLIAAVGTYFNQSGINYKVEIFVNDVLKLTQEGISPYLGYHTIKLNNYIAVKKGDVFKAVITSNGVPFIGLSDTRVHYTENISFVSFDGQPWQDAYKLGYIACLKAYTVADDSKIINNENIAVDYDGGKYFSVNVVTADGIAVAGASVKFTINGKSKTVQTDANGIAKIKITDIPKKYTITTTYNGKSVKNTVTVKQVLKAKKATVKKTAKKFTLKATLKINGKKVKGKKITFKFKGKTYKVKTNKKGVAQKKLNKKVIKKLKKGKKYTVKVTYKKDTIKTTVKVK